ncbi:hypothetical protein [Chengkuizengella marina]|uniref:hypothetical protein n=1 Tax=Chengkuizengella marina TaxID=2507566 RepID=UPI00191C695A|nr:hypothetical protein [Chengkuizengella marina]
MAYGNKVKLHYDIPVFIKKQLMEIAKKQKITATECLSRIIEEEYAKLKEEDRKTIL